MKNKRVDFLGAPGVGKSTIYREFIKNNNNSKIITSDTAFKLSLKHYLNDLSVNQAQKVLLQSSFYLPFLNNIMFDFLKLKTKPISLKKAYILENEFMCFVDKFYNEINLPSSARKLQGYYYFIDRINYYFQTNTYLQGYTIIYDESLAQKVFGFCGVRNINEYDLKYIKKYFLKMPLPDYLIYTYNTAENIVRNLNERKNVDGRLLLEHENREDIFLKQITESANVITKIGRDILGDRGATIIELNTSYSISENVKIIKNTLTQ